MGVKHETLKKAISESFPSCDFKVIATVDDDEHYEIQIKSKEFEGLSKVAQHRIVFTKLSGVLSKIHAIVIKTST
jgi:stress-induced morphogen